MTEPSLSSAVKSMLHDELWAELKKKCPCNCPCPCPGNDWEKLEQRVAITESTLAQWQATVWAKQIEQRVATLEQVTAGPPEGPGFGQLEQRVAALEHSVIVQPQEFESFQNLEERVAALEELCAGCKEANELIESMPLPREELD